MYILLSSLHFIAPAADAPPARIRFCQVPYVACLHGVRRSGSAEAPSMTVSESRIYSADAGCGAASCTSGILVAPIEELISDYLFKGCLS